MGQAMEKPQKALYHVDSDRQLKMVWMQNEK